MRSSQHSINPLFLNRISARELTGEKISHETMLTLLEAAQWAPSAYNEQPWLFAYAFRESQTWNQLLDCLASGNKKWAQDSAVLGIMLAKKTFTKNNKPNPSALFDTGTAFENMALQGSMLGLTVIALGGLDWQKLHQIAQEKREILETHKIAGMFVVGKPQQKQAIISQRKPLENNSVQLD